MLKDRAIIYLAIAQTLVWAAFYYTFPALLLRWEASLGWQRTELTAAFTLAILISALASPFTGRITDAGKGPWMMAGGSIGGGLCLLGLSYVTEITQFYILWGLIGMMMAGCLYEPCFALITRARGANAKPAIILVTLMAGFAGTISFPLAHSLADAWGWRVALQVFAAIVLLLAAPLMWMGAIRVERSGAGSSLHPELIPHQRRFLTRPAFWLLAFGFAMAALVHGVALHHLLPILNERGIASEVAVVAASFIGPMQVAGRLALMAAGSQVSNHSIALTCFILLTLSIFMLMGAAATPALLVGFVILFGSAYGMVSIVRPIIAHEILGGRNFGAKSGALALVYLAGAASAPYLGSVLWGWGGYDRVLVILVVLALLGLFSYLAAQRYAQQ